MRTVKIPESLREVGEVFAKLLPCVEHVWSGQYGCLTDPATQLVGFGLGSTIGISPHDGLTAQFAGEPTQLRRDEVVAKMAEGIDLIEARVETLAKRADDGIAPNMEFAALCPDDCKGDVLAGRLEIIGKLRDLAQMLFQYMRGNLDWQAIIEFLISVILPLVLKAKQSEKQAFAALSGPADAAPAPAADA